MFLLHFGKKDNGIYSPADGKLIDLEKVADKVFASKMMGEGVAFILEGNVVSAPCEGEITMIAPTKHAFGMKMNNGAEVLVHIGLDTVNLNGKGLQTLAKVGSYVKHGTPIIKIDRKLMAENSIDPDDACCDNK